jgi:hypothetical protein
VHGMAGVLGPVFDEHPAMFRKFPHGLCVAREEGWWAAQQALVPRQRRWVVVDRDTCEQVDGHAVILRTNPYVGVDLTDEEIEANLEDDAAELDRLGVPIEQWIPERPFDSADYREGSA